MSVRSKTEILSGHFEATSSSEVTYTIKSFRSLSDAQQRRVKAIISATKEGVSIAGVMVTERPWDLRPFVRVGNAPELSVVRVLGPEVSLNQTISSQAQKFLESISRRSDRSKIIEAWGDFEGQLWYRRGLAENTIEDLVLDGAQLNLLEAMRLIVQCAEEISRWHSVGVIHGHVCSRNIGIDKNGEVKLLDFGIASYVVKAVKSLAIEDGIGAYNSDEFAPEIKEGKIPSKESDCYGFGLVARHILRMVDESSFSEVEHKVLRHLTIFIEYLTKKEESSRPKLSEFFALLNSLNRTLTETDSSEIEVKEKRTGTEGKGKVIQTRKGAGVSSPRKGDAVEVQTKSQTESFENQTTKDQRKEPKINKQGPASTKPQKRPTSEFTFVDDADIFLLEEKDQQTVENVQSDVTKPIILQAPKDRNNPLFGFFMKLGVVALVVVLLIRYLSTNSSQQESDFSQYRSMTQEQLQLGWSSGIPSKMIPVVAVAVDPEQPNSAAEQLIVSSALRGDASLPGLDFNMIRIAYNKGWEAELTPADRRATLVLASTALFKGAIPLQGEALNKLHPAVIFAITASAGENAQRILQTIPASVFEKLPPPISPAFSVLLSAYPKISCGDERVLMLSQIITGGANNPLLLSKFTQDDPLIRLRAIALAFSQSADQARSILGIMLNHPNVQMRNEYADWARKVELVKWEDLDSSEQLLLLSGVAPEREMSPAHIGYMFSHPAPAVRSAAIRKAIDSIQFAHPAALDVLSALKDDPAMLDGNQTFRLAQFLEQPAQAKVEAIRSWLETKPKPELLIKMLLGTAKSPRSTVLDFEISRALQGMGWRPRENEIRVLVGHPERLTKLFAFAEAIRLPEKQKAAEILRGALETEKDPEQRKVIEDNLKVVGG